VQPTICAITWSMARGMISYLEFLDGLIFVREGKLKAAIVTFNHYWIAEEVVSKPILGCSFFMCCKLVYFLC
jgi:hypothetical protein